jgi:putative transposase
MAQRVKRAFKYRFYPTDEQAAELSRTFGCVRLVYNRALAERTTAWYSEQRRVNYNQSSAALTEWKKDPGLAFLNEVSSVPLQQGLRHLQTAFRNFFDKRAKYPRYKSRKKSRASAEYTRSGFKYRDGRLTLAKMSAPLDIRWSRPLPEGAEPSTGRQEFQPERPGPPRGGSPVSADTAAPASSPPPHGVPNQPAKPKGDYQPGGQ